MKYIIERDTDEGWFPVEALDCDWRDIRGKAAAWAKALDCEVRVIDTRHKPSDPSGSNVIGHYGPEHAATPRCCYWAEGQPCPTHGEQTYDDPS